MAQAGQQIQHLFARFAVQRASRFVAEQQRRVFAQRSGNGYTLLLAAGELGREVVHSLSQPNLLQHFTRIKRAFADLLRQFDVLQRRQVRHQIVELKDETHVVAAVFRQLRRAKPGDFLIPNNNSPAGRFVHAAEQVQHGGFARAGRSQHHAELALFNVKIDMIGRVNNGIARWVVLADIFKRDVAHAIHLLSSILHPYYTGRR